MDWLLYHFPCPDGAFAALAAWLALTAAGRSVRFAPQVSYVTPAARVAALPALGIAPEDTVHLLDFSGGVEYIRALCVYAARVRLVDHHKTAAEDLAALGAGVPANLEVHIDMGRSGATMARDTYDVARVLAARLGADGAARVATLFAYVEDNDLWRHALPHSKEFTAGLAAAGLEYDANKHPGLWEALLALEPAALIASGRARLAEDERVIAVEAAAAYRVAIPYGDASGQQPQVLHCLAALTTHPDLRSGLGNAVAAAAGATPGCVAAGAVVYEEPGMGAAAAAAQYKVSLRSVGDVDTTPVSKAYGGGGHKNASSFNVDKAVWAGWAAAGAAAAAATAAAAAPAAAGGGE